MEHAYNNNHRVQVQLARFNRFPFSKRNEPLKKFPVDCQLLVASVFFFFASASFSFGCYCLCMLYCCICCCCCCLLYVVLCTFTLPFARFTIVDVRCSMLCKLLHWPSKSPGETRHVFDLHLTTTILEQLCKQRQKTKLNSYSFCSKRHWVKS